VQGRRIERVNSLLKEVIATVIKREVKNPHIPELLTITSVQVSRDLHHAKVFVSLIQGDKAQALKALQSAAGFIAVKASKEVVLRYFPELTFVLDDSVDKQMRIQAVIHEIRSEREGRVTYDD